MIYKGKNKIYFGIGLERDYASFGGYVIYFYFFKLIRRNDDGVMRTNFFWDNNQKGFNFRLRFSLPVFGINI